MGIEEHGKKKRKNGLKNRKERRLKSSEKKRTGG